MGRSAPADYREFIRVSVDLPDNPKLAMIDDPAASWAYVVALCYCGRNLTDGSFPLTIVVRQAGVRPTVAQRLIEANLWHKPGHDCPRCLDPKPGQVVVHDYLEHQRSSDEAKALREARREAGRRGAQSRWSENDGGKSHGNGHSKSDGKTHGKPMAEPWQDDDNGMAEGEVEEESEKTTSSHGRRKREPQRDDVDHLCRLLAEHAIRHTDQEPKVSEAWRRSMRLLLDTDLGPETDPLALAVRVFEWMQRDDFWPPNVLSAPTFRKQFPKMRAKAKHEWEMAQRASGTDRHLAAVGDGPPPPQGTASQRAQAFLNLRKGTSA